MYSWKIAVTGGVRGWGSISEDQAKDPVSSRNWDGYHYCTVVADRNEGKVFRLPVQ